MIKSSFSLTHEDRQMRQLIETTDHKTLAIWGKVCALRVLPLFVEKFPNDPRPLMALQTLQAWIDTGEFHMPIIRKASLDSHAAARDIGEDSAARSAARACGQAVAIAHVKTHAYGPAIYAQQAIFRETGSMDKVMNERNHQYQYLLQLNSKREVSI